jgi:hypothetical protein
MDTIDRIIAFESGTLDDIETLNLFGELISNGQAWSLQGSYGRFAESLIERGFIDDNGVIDWDYANEVLA